MVFVILTIINKIENLILPRYKTHTLKIVLEDRPGIINDLKKTLAKKKVKVLDLNASMSDRETIKLSLVIRKPHKLGMDSIINLTNTLSETKSMEIN